MPHEHPGPPPDRAPQSSDANETESRSRSHDRPRQCSGSSRLLRTLSRFSRFSPRARFGPGNAARSQEGAEGWDARLPPRWPRARNPSAAFRMHEFNTRRAEAGITAAAATRFAAQRILLKRFKRGRVPTTTSKESGVVFHRCSPRSRVGNVRVCCLPWLG